MTYSLFWDVTQRRLLAADVSDNSSSPSSRVQQSKGFFGSFTVEDVNYRLIFPKRQTLTTHPCYVTSQKSKDIEITSVYSGKQTGDKQMRFVK